ncbi:MAG: hypothetical protein NE330_05480 [Lentisphaeraceae bacterium]|nr:hypothetical protein [Lentisphaeraceae bacterium]
MKTICLILISFILNSYSQTPSELTSKAKLIFEDNFNRKEANTSKEELGKSWKTNSQKRAKGVKQADLRDDVLYIKMAKEADHGVSVLHTNPFNNGVVKIKFKLLDSKGIAFNFNDPKAKKVTWAGHVCAVKVTPKAVKIEDQIDGRFRLDIYKLNKEGKKKEAAKLRKGKDISKKNSLDIGKWYEMTMIFQDTVLSAYIDDKKITELDSKGLAHLKDNIAFAVSGEVEVDDLRVYSLD